MFYSQLPFFIVFLACLGSIFTYVECCRVKKFFSPVHGKALEGHVFKTLELPRQDMCRVNCYLEDSCQSYNLASSEQNDSWECELSSTEHIQHPGSLVNSPSKVYHATQVVETSANVITNIPSQNSLAGTIIFHHLMKIYCVGNRCGRFPCTENATCQPHFSKDDSYTCICTVGFHGQRCDTDVDECTDGSHNCSVNAWCYNVIGSFNCTCILGFGGDGVNCTAVKRGFGPEIAAQSCQEVFEDTPNAPDGAYYLKFNDGQVHRTYCHVTYIPGCGAGPWTLVMKLNGHLTTFTYTSPLWSDMQSYHLEGGVTGFDEEETKLPSYWSTPFTKLCLGMKVAGVTHWLLLSYTALSLHSLIADGQHRPTSLGRDAWKTLIAGSDLQPICNQEGFNAYSYTALVNHPTATRIGIVANDIAGFYGPCVDGDSRIGFGAAGNLVTQDNSNSCGNEAWLGWPASDKHLKAHCYILVQ